MSFDAVTRQSFLRRYAEGPALLRRAWEDVPARAASHDQSALAHTRPPCIKVRFSWSMRSTTAMAARLIRMAEPP